MQQITSYDLNETIKLMKEERVKYGESMYSTVTKGGKAHLRILQLHKVLTEADLDGGLVKIEYLRGV